MITYGKLLVAIGLLATTTSISYAQVLATQAGDIGDDATWGGTPGINMGVAGNAGDTYQSNGNQLTAGTGSYYGSLEMQADDLFITASSTGAAIGFSQPVTLTSGHLRTGNKNNISISANGGLHVSGSSSVSSVRSGTFTTTTLTGDSSSVLTLAARGNGPGGRSLNVGIDDLSGFEGLLVLAGGNDAFGNSNINLNGAGWDDEGNVFGISLSETIDGSDTSYGVLNMNSFDDGNITVASLEIGGEMIGDGVYTYADLIAINSDFGSYLGDGDTNTITVAAVSIPEPLSILAFLVAGLIGLPAVQLLRRR